MGCFPARIFKVLCDFFRPEFIPEFDHANSDDFDDMSHRFPLWLCSERIIALVLGIRNEHIERLRVRHGVAVEHRVR